MKADEFVSTQLCVCASGSEKLVSITYLFSSTPWLGVSTSSGKALVEEEEEEEQEKG